MNKNNKTMLIAIISIIITIILLGGVLAYCYFFTDVFKSNKQLFFKYIAQNENIFTELNDDMLKNYYDKLQSTPYDNDGKISFGLNTSDSQSQEKLDKLNNISVSFNGSTDNTNNYDYRKVKLNYSDDVSLDFDYIHSNDYFGIKEEEILKKYIGIENNNLKEFVEKFGQDSSNVPDKIDFDKLKEYLNGNNKLFTEEELIQIKNTYMPIIVNNLKDDSFSKTKISENDIYTLTLKKDDTKNILVQLLTKLKDDQLILNKLKEKYIEVEEVNSQSDEFITNFQKRIQEYIDSMQESVDDNTIEDNTNINDNSDIIINLTVYKKNLLLTDIVCDENKVIINKTEKGIKIEDQSFNEEDNNFITESSIEINKIKNNDELKYNAIISFDGANNIDFTINYSGINTLSEVTTESSLDINRDLSNNMISTDEEENDKNTIEVKFNYNNKTTFKDNINTDFNINQDAVIFNNYDANKIQALFEKISEAFTNVNNKKMEEAKFDGSILNYMFSGLMTYNTTKNTINNSDKGLSEMEKEAFNSKFTSYEGKEVSGLMVNALLQTINTSNESERSNGGQIIETLIINGNSYDITNENYEEKVSTDKTYNVETEENEEGYIYLIDIEERN